MNDTRKDAIRRVMDVIHTDGMVTDGRLPTERCLSELTGLGRPLLREALIAMEGMGILDIRNRQGIYLNESRGDELAHTLESAPIWLPSRMLAGAMEMRLIIDPVASAIAACRRSDRDIAEIETCLKRLQDIRLRAGENEAKDGAYWNSMLHSAIFNATGNVLLIRAHDSLISLTEKGVALMRERMPIVKPAWREMILAEHRSIVEAIIRADPAEAKHQMERHIGHTVENMSRLGQLGEGARAIRAVFPSYREMVEHGQLGTEPDSFRSNRAQWGEGAYG